MKVLPIKNNFNEFLKYVLLFVIFSVFGEHTLGQCTVDIGPATTYGCVGGTVTLTATLTNPPASPTYSWTGPGGFTSNSASITISNLNVSNAGTYTVSVSGCTNSPITDNLTLVVLENFTITQNNITLCPGQNSINFNPTISGNNSVTPVYSWTGPNSFNSALANPVISSATSTNAGAYNVTATLGQCSVSDEANVLVLNNLNVSASSNGPLCQGQNLNLSSSVTGNSGQSVNYSWTGPNGYTSSLANPTISNVSSAQNGTYTVTLTLSGCTDTEQIPVIVNSNPTTPTFTIPAIGCPQVSIPISGFTPVTGLTYVWNATNSGPNVNGGNTSTPTLNFNTGGNFSYTVTATNPTTGCSSTSVSDAINITSVDVFNPDISYSGTQNYLAPAELYAGVYTYDVCNVTATGSIQLPIVNITST
ncbi:MAG: hypothetical protein RL664_339, partial [Bacteroidota bacterium]